MSQDLPPILSSGPGHTQAAGRGRPTAASDPELGAPGPGLSGDIAFDPSNVLRNGLQTLQEAPLLTLAGGGLIWVGEMMSVLPWALFFASVLPELFEALGSGRELDPNTLPAMAQGWYAIYALSLLGGAVRLYFTGTALRTFAVYVRTDRKAFDRLLLDVGAGLSRVVYGVVESLLISAGMAFASIFVMVLMCCMGSMVGGETQSEIATGMMVLMAGMGFIMMSINVFLQLSFQIGRYAAAIDVDPIGAVSQTWKRASGARIHLLLTDLLFGLFFGAFYMADVLMPVGGMLTIFAAILGLAMLRIPLNGVWVAGLSASYMMHSRHALRVVEWPFMLRSGEGS